MSLKINVQKESGSNAVTGSLVVPSGKSITTTGSGTIAATSAPASGLTGVVDVPHGGTGATTLTGYVKGTGTAALTASATVAGADVSGDISGNAANVNGTVTAAHGGTGLTATPTNGQVAIGNGTGYTLGTLTAGVGVSIANGTGTITISADGGINYQGTWNAATNTPTLTSSVGTKGFYYVVNVAGTTNLNGITDWQVGDWAVFNGATWQKVDNTDQVVSVFGRQGAVVGVSTDYSSVGLTNTAIGATNPSTGSFTTLTSSGNFTSNGASYFNNGYNEFQVANVNDGLTFRNGATLVGGITRLNSRVNFTASTGAPSGFTFNAPSLANAVTIGASGDTAITSSTASSSTSTGALVVTGGVGVGGALYVGGAMNIAGGISLSGAVSITNATASTSTTTGALVVTGGVGVGGAINAGGKIATTTANEGLALTASGATTAIYSSYTNSGSGGSLYIGKDNSTGGILTGTAYANMLWDTGNNPFVIGTNGLLRATISSSGTSLTGNLTVSGGSIGVGGAIGSYLDILQGGNDAYVYNRRAGSLIFGTNNTTVLSFGSSTLATFFAANDPAGMLFLQPTTSADYFGLVFNNRSSGAAAASRRWQIANNYNGNGDLVFLQSSTSTGAANNTVAQFASSGNLLLGTTTDSGQKFQVKTGIYGYTTALTNTVGSGDVGGHVLYLDASRSDTTNTRLIASKDDKFIVYSNGTTSVGGNLTVSGSTATIAPSGALSTLTLGDGTAGSYSRVILRGNATQNAWAIYSNNVTSNALEFFPSTAGGGTTFSTAAFTLTSSSATLAGNLTVSGTGTSSFAGSNQFGDNISPYSSATKLTVGGTSADAYSEFGQSSTNKMFVGWLYNASTSLARGYIQTYGANNPIAIQPSGGNLLIGTTTDGGQKLQVSGNAAIKDSLLVATTNDPTNYYFKASANYNYGKAFSLEVRGGGATIGDIITWADAAGLTLNSLTGSSLTLKTSNVTALTIDSSQNATFAKKVAFTAQATGTTLVDLSSTDDAKILGYGGGNTFVKMGGNLNLSSAGYTFISTAGSTALTLDSSQNATFAGASVSVSKAGNNPQYRAIDGSIITKLQSLSAGDTAGWVGTESNHTFRIVTNNTARLTVDTSGNLGIGTTSPQAKLDVYNSLLASASITNTNAQIKISTPNNATLQQTAIYFEPFNTTGNTSPAAISAIASGNTASALAFYTNPNSTYLVTPTERMRITSDGNLGVGTSSPADNGSAFKTLTVNGSTGGVLELQNNGSSAGQIYVASDGFFINAYTGATRPMRFLSSGTEYMRLTNSGNLLVGTSTDNANGKLQVAGRVNATDGSGLAISVARQLGSTYTSSAAAMEAQTDNPNTGANNQAFGAYRSGDTYYRYVMSMDGRMNWGSGSAAQDLALSRITAGYLAMQTSGSLDPAFVIRNATGGSATPQLIFDRQGIQAAVIKLTASTGTLDFTGATASFAENVIFSKDARLQSTTGAYTWFKDATPTKAWGIGSNGWAGLSGGDGSMIFGLYTGSAWAKGLELDNATQNATFAQYLGVGLLSTNTDDGAAFSVRKYVNRNLSYHNPAGYYAATLGKVNNTYPTVWASIDADYSQGSAVSAGLYLKAFFADAGGSACGYTIKNLASGNPLVFSSVTTASSPSGSSATETERMRLTASGNLLLGTTTDSSNGKLQLATHTTSAGGIGFGSDLALFRMAQGLFQQDSTGTQVGYRFSKSGTMKGQLVWSGSDTYLDYDGNLFLRAGYGGTTALTLDASQNATFAGNIAVQNTTAKIYAGSGSPEGVVTASPGSLYLNTSGGNNTTLYVKQSGTGNTGWNAK